MRTRPDIPASVFLRYFFAAVALAWVLTTVKLGRMLSLLWSIPSITVAGVVAVSLLGIVSGTWMWMVLFGHFDGAEFRDAVRADLVVKFVNTILPSRLGGRSVAPLVFRHYTGASWGDATAVTAAHTALYAVCYGLVSLIGLAVLASSLSSGVLLIVALSTGVYVAVGGLIITGGWHLDRLDSVFVWFGTALGYLPVIGDRLTGLVESAAPVVRESATAFRTVIADRRAVAGYGMSWVLALAVLPSIRIYLLFVGLGTTPGTPWLLPLYLITAYAVTILPLTPGGIGVAEATSTLVFVSLGYPQAVVVPAVVLDRFLGVYLPALAGWYPTTTANLGKHIPEWK